ncbi:MAG: hypothetical protein AAFN68_03755 [Pseudomonadota bacterium]
MGALSALAWNALSGRISLEVKKKFEEENELEALVSELKDIGRHCSANVVVIRNIDMTKGIPMNMHLEKLKMPSTSMISSLDTYRIINSSHTELIHRMKLRIRNINIEIDGLILYINYNNLEVDVIRRYINYIEEKMIYLESRIENEIISLRGQQIKYSGPARSTRIIYRSR